MEFRKIKSLNYLYEINEDGTCFRNVKTGKELTIKLDKHHSKSGYYATFVHLNGRKKDGKTVRVMIHRAVAECWLGDIPEGYEVDHIDRNTHNNHYSNLRYVTKSEQMKNRDHSNISKKGKENLEKARKDRMISVNLINDDANLIFDSLMDASKYLSLKYNKSIEQIRYLFKKRRNNVFDFQVIYKE